MKNHILTLLTLPVISAIHYVKSVRIRIFSGPYFPAFRLNMERHYGVYLRIQSEWRKIRTRKTANMDPFHAVKIIMDVFFLTKWWRRNSVPQSTIFLSDYNCYVGQNKTLSDKIFPDQVKNTDNASVNFILFHELFHFALLRELAERIGIIDRPWYPSFRHTLTASIFAGIEFCGIR